MNKLKRKLKTEPKFKINLSQEQRDAKAKFYEYDVNFVLGDFGSGKTLLSCEIALSAFRKKQFNKIVIARPITGDDLGFLPGDMHQKMQPWIAPIIHNFNMLQGKVLTEKMIAEGEIEILPIKYAKGITYVDSVVIIDEFTDLNYLDFRTMLTRLGRDSKIIFCGSEEQIDLKMKKYSCIHEVEKLEDSGIVGYSTLTDNHRNEDIMKIINYLEDENNDRYKEEDIKSEEVLHY